MPNTAEFFIKEQEKSESQSSSVENKIKELKIPQPDQFGKISSNLIRQGHGSGLDADLLDGYEAFQFARRDAPGLFSDGSASLPSISFTNDPDTGLYSPGGGDLYFSGNGTNVIQFKSGGEVRVANGAATTPSFSFTGDADTGMWYGGTNILSFSTAGAERANIQAGGEFRLKSRGVVTTPSFSLIDDTDVGMWSAGANILNFSTAGVEALRITADQGVGLVDGITAPATVAGYALLYVDTADGDLKVKFGDGTVKTIVTDT